MEKHQIPVNYLNNPALAEELQSAHDARTPAAIEAAYAKGAKAGKTRGAAATQTQAQSKNRTCGR